MEFYALPEIQLLRMVLKCPSDQHRLFLFYCIKRSKVFINCCISAGAARNGYICTSLFQIMSTISITRLYDLLSDKVGKETAESLTSFIVEKVKEETDNKTQSLATKADVANAKADTIKWMFIFWIGQIAATFGFILLFLRK